MARTMVTAGGGGNITQETTRMVGCVSVGSAGTVISATKLVSGIAVDVPHLTSILHEQVPGEGRDFPQPSRSALWPPQPPIR